MKTAYEIVKETIDFYSNDPSKRGFDGTYCVNLDPNTGNMCAFARCSTNPAKIPEGSITFYTHRELQIAEDLIKEEYKGHPTSLWRSLQSWHDNTLNWNAEGLTQKGKKDAESLLIKYKEN